jgi:hypothetical protein
MRLVSVFSHFVDVYNFLGSGGRGEAARDGRPPGGLASLAIWGAQLDAKELYTSAKWEEPVYAAASKAHRRVGWAVLTNQP